MRRWPALTLLCTVLAAPTAAASAAPQAPTAYVRVNQVGYDAGGAKSAYVLANRDVRGHTFRVVDAGGSTVLNGEAARSTGEWNNGYPYVSPIDLSALTKPGTYTVRFDDPETQSPPFRVGSPTDLYGPLLTNARTFFEVQRDGPDVIKGALDRLPSHLNDRAATVYAPPSYRRYELTEDLEEVGGPVDVSGGWFDAGDYLKFVETTSYADTLLLIARRDTPELGPGNAADLTAEVRFGTDWLQRMWDDDTRTLLYQVGIGDGNGCGSICGDHDLWRLPEVDDTYQPSQDRWRYLRERPALRAGTPGAPLSPNLAGRLASAFALCSQVFRDSDEAYADACLQSGQHVYDLADTTSPKLLSVSPNGYYPETSWRDDLELGAAELARATLDAGTPGADGDTARYLREAASWAKENLRRDRSDTLNLYDVSGLAHAELHRAIDEAGDPGGLAVSREDLRGGIRDLVNSGVRQAGREPFGVGVRYGYDVASHLFGLVVLARDYDSLVGDSTYATFAADQLGTLFGANAWGTSFVVGAGTVFPECMQHQVANLNGSLDGSAPLVLGAVVNGPNRNNQLRHLGLPDGARKCPPNGTDPYGQFTGHGGRYLDDVRSWPTVEPAIDFTATSMLALARTVSPVSR